MAITIELDFNQDVIMRETLTAMDILADIGGFAEVLIFTGSLFLSVLNHQYLNSLLVKKLYKEANSDDPDNPVEFKI